MAAGGVRGLCIRHCLRDAAGLVRRRCEPVLWDRSQQVGPEDFEWFEELVKTIVHDNSAGHDMTACEVGGSMTGIS